MSEPSFHELGLSEPVSQALAKRDIHAPFEIQALVLRDAIAGLDILAKSPTGSGKTLAFALPIVDGCPRTTRGRRPWCWCRPASWPSR